jgi:hypothetical protein
MSIRVFSPYDLNVSYEASSFTDVFDVYTAVDIINEIPAQSSDQSITPRQYIHWLQKMYSENTDYLKDFFQVKVNRFQAQLHHPEHPFSENREKEVDLYLKLFKNHPDKAWLCEFLSFTNQSGSPVFIGERTRIYSFKLLCGGPEYQGNWDYAIDDIWLNDNSNVTEFLEGLLENFQLYLLTGESRNLKKSYSALTSMTYSNRVLNSILMFATNKLSITYKDRNNNGLAYDTLKLVALVHNSNLNLNDYSISLESSYDYLCVFYKRKVKIATRREISSVLNYSSNVLDFLPFTIRSPKEEKAPLYGIELEASTDYSPADAITHQKDLFFICKSDGSITGKGYYKYEIVTVPATFKSHKRLWADWFSKLDYNKFDTSKNTGNGMHVHVDRKAFYNKEHLDKFTWFFINPANYDFHFEVSERPNKHDFQRWSPTPCLESRGASTKLKTLKSAAACNGGLRGIVHFKRDVSVEVRMFKGVVSYATLVKNLEFVDSVFHFTGEHRSLQISLKTYLNWLNSLPKNKYTMLRKFLSELATLETILTSNEIKEYLYLHTSVESTVNKLNKAPFKVTNKHLTILNKERKKRTYILNKDGSISLAYAIGGKLAPLDVEFQQKMNRGSSAFVINTLHA